MYSGEQPLVHLPGQSQYTQKNEELEKKLLRAGNKNARDNNEASQTIFSTGVQFKTDEEDWKKRYGQKKKLKPWERTQRARAQWEVYEKYKELQGNKEKPEFEQKREASSKLLLHVQFV